MFPVWKRETLGDQMTTLKPHDVVLALKIGSIALAHRSSGLQADASVNGYSITDLSESLWLSRGEVSKSLRRLSSLFLISVVDDESGRRYSLLRKNMEEFLVGGIRYGV